MKKTLRKTLTVLLALVLSLAALLPAAALAEEQTTFKIMYLDRYGGYRPEDMTGWQAYMAGHADLNVQVEWISLGDDSVVSEKKSILFSGGTYDDAVWGSVLSDTDVSMLSAQGILIALDEYITEENTPNLYKLFSDHPEFKAASTLPDGHIYSLPQFAGSNPGNFIESPIRLNKTWLDKLELEVPTTLDELFDVLMAFKTQDPNGNGLADEIPLFIYDADAFKHVEAWLGIWGIATKSNAYDSYVFIQDGEVHFAPTTEAYKEAIKFLNRLYENGLIWSEAFTATAEEANAKFASTNSPCIIGCVTSREMSGYEDEYITVLPPVAEGYEPCWYYHPGSLGTKNVFAITDKCQDPELLMRLWDDLYSTYWALVNSYGTEEDGILYKNEDGLWDYHEVEDAPVNGIAYMGQSIDGYLTEYAASKGDLERTANYEVYKDIINQEVWPRPYFDEDAVSRLSELRTDIFNTVSQMKAKWITGESDIDADWEGYLKNLKKMGVDEFVELNQAAYDAFKANMAF